MNTLLQAVTVTAMPERPVDLDVGNAMIVHSLAETILHNNSESILLSTLEASQDFAASCDMKKVKPADRAEWIRTKINTWHNKVVTSSDHFDSLCYPAKGDNQIIGSFVTTGKPTKANPNGTISMGFTLRSFVSKIAKVFASTGGKAKIKAAKTTTAIATKYSDLKAPTHSDALRKVVSEAMTGKQFKKDANVKMIKHLVALKKVMEAMAVDCMETIPAKKAA